MQRLRAIIACAALWILPASHVSAQVVGNDDARLPLTGIDTRAAAIIPGAPPTLMQFTVDPASGGGDLFDVVSSHPQVAVSLILPGGAEVNAANAESQGFSFDVFTTSANADFASASTFDLPGTHTLIGLPSSSPSGTYQVKLDGSAVNTTTEAVIATYYSASSVRAGAKACETRHRRQCRKVMDYIVVLQFDTRFKTFSVMQIAPAVATDERRPVGERHDTGHRKIMQVGRDPRKLRYCGAHIFNARVVEIVVAENKIDR